jgi:O-antigen biosynthesis protein
VRGLPFVTCLCLTRNRREWLPKAIQCFREQTYPSRELLILADGVDVRDLVPASSQIRLIHIEEGYTIGQKRNFGTGQARGEVIATWDDDDYSAPYRIEDQIVRLRSSGLAVTGYHSMRFTDGKNSWRFERQRDFAIGTSLMYRKSWWIAHPFSHLQIGEDRDFRDVAIKENQLISVDAGELMLGTIHAGNTEPRWMEGQNWRKLA